MSEIGVCSGCDYEQWARGNPDDAINFLNKLKIANIKPTGEGKEDVSIGSPFRYPLPVVARLCCLDRQICEEQQVDLSRLNTKSDSDAAINRARNEVFRSVGLPTIGEI